MEPKSLTREELYQQVWETPIIQLTEKYNLSDYGLRKKCEKYNIPLPPLGYWTKLKYGIEVEKIPLPKIEGKGNLIDLYADDEVNIDDPSAPFNLRLRQIKREIETCTDLPLEIPGRLTNPDKLVQSTREFLISRKQENANWDRIDKNNVLDISVSKGSTDRALLIMDYFIKLIRARGHDIKIEYGRTHVLMYTTEEEISLREKYNTITLDEYPYRKQISSGNLVFRAKPSYHKTWHDAKSVPLEEKIISIIAWLETKARDLKAHWDMNARRRQEEEERLRIEREIKERKENEIKKFNELLDEAERWHKARILREYIRYLEDNGIHNHGDFKNWLDWARGKADWLDPLVNREDNVLGEYKEFHDG